MKKRKAGRKFTLRGLFQKHGFKITTIDDYLWRQINSGKRRPAQTEKTLKFFPITGDFWVDYESREYLLLISSLQIFVRTGYHAGRDRVTGSKLESWKAENQAAIEEVTKIWNEQQEQDDERTKS